MSKEPISAARISVGASLHVMLHDKDGNVFATATMPLETGWRLVDDIVISLQTAAAGKTIGACQGHA